MPIADYEQGYCVNGMRGGDGTYDEIKFILRIKYSIRFSRI